MTDGDCGRFNLLIQRHGASRYCSGVVERSYSADLNDSFAALLPQLTLVNARGARLVRQLGPLLPQR